MASKVAERAGLDCDMSCGLSGATSTKVHPFSSRVATSPARIASITCCTGHPQSSAATDGTTQHDMVQASRLIPACHRPRAGGDLRCVNKLRRPRKHRHNVSYKKRVIYLSDSFLH